MHPPPAKIGVQLGAHPMFYGSVNLSSVLVPLSGQASHIVPLVMGGLDGGAGSLAERALPTCRALDLWAARSRPAAHAPAVSDHGFSFQAA